MTLNPPSFPIPAIVKSEPLRALKGRLAEYLEQVYSMDTCFGARDEYRLSLALLQAIDLIK